MTVKTFSKIEASNAILFSYPIIFVHVIIIDCCSNFYWKVCISAVGILVTEWLYVKLYIDCVKRG